MVHRPVEGVFRAFQSLYTIHYQKGRSQKRSIGDKSFFNIRQYACACPFCKTDFDWPLSKQAPSKLHLQYICPFLAIILNTVAYRLHLSLFTWMYFLLRRYNTKDAGVAVVMDVDYLSCRFSCAFLSLICEICWQGEPWFKNEHFVCPRQCIVLCRCRYGVQ